MMGDPWIGLSGFASGILLAKMLEYLFEVRWKQAQDAIGIFVCNNPISSNGRIQLPHGKGSATPPIGTTDANDNGFNNGNGCSLRIGWIFDVRVFERDCWQVQERGSGDIRCPYNFLISGYFRHYF
jgi:hypothetical protein